MRVNISKRLFSAMAFLVIACVHLNAQQTFSITAKQAVDIAFQNVASLKNAKLDYKIAEARNKEITGAALPQVSGALQGNHYLSLPLIQFPDAAEDAIYRVLDREGVKDASGQPINPDNAEFNVNSFSFFAPWNVTGSLTVNQLLFEPQVFVGLQARKALLESGDINVKVEEDKVREAVYKSYYAVLIAEKQILFTRESIKRLEKLTSDMNVMFTNGFVEKLDIDKTTVTLNNTKAIENQLNNAIAIGYAVLKATMGLSQSDSLILVDELSSTAIKDGVLEENFSYENRNEIKLLNKAVELQEYDIRVGKEHR